MVEPQDVFVVEAPDPPPELSLGTETTLSIIRRQDVLSPFRAFGSTGTRKSGASVGFVVKAQTVINSVASKASSWRMTTGRGFPA